MTGPDLARKRIPRPARPTPTKAELLARLVVCAAALHLRSEEAEGDYKPYFADRAQQCRKWIAGLREGPADIEYIAGGLAEFEATARIGQ